MREHYVPIPNAIHIQSLWRAAINPIRYGHHFSEIAAAILLRAITGYTTQLPSAITAETNTLSSWSYFLTSRMRGGSDVWSLGSVAINSPIPIVTSWCFCGWVNQISTHIKTSYSCGAHKSFMVQLTFSCLSYSVSLLVIALESFAGKVARRDKCGRP